MSGMMWPADRVERFSIDAVLPYARNAKTHPDWQIKKIAEGIDRWGWTVPVLVAEDGSLIAGHGRVLAARQLGISQIPGMVARGWSDAQIKAYRLADNRIAESPWDKDMLHRELRALADAGIDIDVTGFNESDLDNLLDAPEMEAPDGFKEFDESIETEYCCPACEYRWSGKPR